ncbi:MULTISPECIES: hypothetical protein [unclassified Kitasatospora]|uniref:hypothetical protein n=1 Tax=unclassified Kitasatospora TaxID=2633591 RepID=UPI0033D9E6A7
MPDHDAHPLGDDKGGSQLQRAERLKKTIDESHGMWGAGDLKYAVHDALQLAAPKGDSGKLGELAAAYNTASSQVDQIQMKAAQVSSQHLPDARTGQVGEKAVEVVKASADDLGRCREMLGKGRDQLKALATALSEAQTLHGQGAAPLSEALNLLHDITVSGAPDPFHWDDDKMHRAHAKAKEGIKSIYDAAVKAENAAAPPPGSCTRWRTRRWPASSRTRGSARRTSWSSPMPPSTATRATVASSRPMT